jgi:hypothetical protein
LRRDEGKDGWMDGWMGRYVRTRWEKIAEKKEGVRKIGEREREKDDNCTQIVGVPRLHEPCNPEELRDQD